MLRVLLSRQRHIVREGQEGDGQEEEEGQGGQEVQPRRGTIPGLNLETNETKGFNSTARRTEVGLGRDCHASMGRKNGYNVKRFQKSHLPKLGLYGARWQLIAILRNTMRNRKRNVFSMKHERLAQRRTLSLKVMLFFFC